MSIFLLPRHCYVMADESVFYGKLKVLSISKSAQLLLQLVAGPAAAQRD